MTATPSFADDDAQIRNLLARYCLLLDLDDIEGWVALFTPNATYEVYGRTFGGHDGLRRMLSGAPSGLHLGGPPVVELVDDNHVRTQRNLLFIDRATGESRSAVYDDDLVRTGEGWRITRCRCQFIVADGLSDDGTRVVVERHVAGHPSFRLIDNPARALQVRPRAREVT